MKRKSVLTLDDVKRMAASEAEALNRLGGEHR